MTQDWPVVIVGIGNLGHALANYSGFASRGFRVVCLVDADSARVGERIGELTITPYAGLAKSVRDNDVAIGVIATPAAAAQRVCDDLVAAGVTSILNFAPAVISVPEGVDVRKVDLSIELQILAYHEQRKSQAGRERPLPGPMDEEIKGRINDVMNDGVGGIEDGPVPDAQPGAEPVAQPVGKPVAVEVETA